MEDSVYKITLDIHSMSAQVSLNAKQGDTGRKICITLMEDGEPYKIADGCYAVFAGKKPDDKILWNACTIEGNAIIYEITAQTVAAVGLVPVQIRLYGAGGKLITSPDFVLTVDAPVVSDSEVVAVSENEITALTQLISEATEMLENFGTGSVSDEQIAQAVADYLVKNPIDVTGNGNGVFVGDAAPEDTSLLWVDTSDETEDEDPVADAIAAALAEAKESGEFDGPQGPQGPRGEDGSDGADGKDGADGYSPVRGVDYWTEDDQTAIVDAVVARFTNVAEEGA